MPSLAVFALLGPNQDPAKVASGLLPQPQVSGGNFLYSFTQPIDVIYGAKWCADLSLANWQPLPDTGTGAQHLFSVPIGDSPQLFLRLKVTNP